jgi:glutamate-1-semialdehyde 2,1-aminomutase
MANLDLITVAGFYQQLTDKTERLVQGLQQAADQTGVPMSTVSLGGMFGVFFTDQREVTSFEQVQACDLQRFKHFFHGMLERGHYFAPSAFEAGFVSQAHEHDMIDRTIAAASAVFADS